MIELPTPVGFQFIYKDGPYSNDPFCDIVTSAWKWKLKNTSFGMAFLNKKTEQELLRDFWRILGGI